MSLLTPEQVYWIPYHLVKQQINTCSEVGYRILVNSFKNVQAVMEKLKLISTQAIIIKIIIQMLVNWVWLTTFCATDDDYYYNR